MTRGTALDDCHLGSYAILDLLARGGTAAVYLAVHAPTGRRVALKLLDPSHANRPEHVERFFAEHLVSRSVRHAGLVDITASDLSEGGVPYLVMELLDGENLGMLSERGLISMDAVAAIGTQIAAAAEAMHRCGFVHCDLKPDNVFVLYEQTSDGWPQIKVIDYGVASRTERGEDADESIAGTPSYMAPEQWRGRPCAQSDVYGLGCLLYELVTGEPPFSGTLPELLTSHTESIPRRPSHQRPDMVPGFESLIMRMLSKDPAMRPQMRDVEYALARFAWHGRTRAQSAQPKVAAVG